MYRLLNTITEEWRPTRDRVLWAPVFLAAGIALYFGLDREPSFAVGACVLALAAGGLCVALARSARLVYPAVAVFLIALGFMLAQGRTMMVASPMLDRNINFTRVEGRVEDVTVADINVATGKKRPKKVTLDSLIIEKLPPEATPARIRLSTYHVPDDVVPGDRIALLARLMPPSGPVAPNGFSYRQQAFFDQMGATGFTMGKFELISKAEAPRNVWFNSLRQKIAARISSQLPHPQSAVTTALLAGERSSIPDNINDDLRDSGLYHLLSISGLHVAIVCGVTFFVLRFLMALIPYLALHWPIKKIAAGAALAAGFFYSMLAGMPVPTERAMLMTGLMLFAVMLDRSALSMRTIALAAFFVLIIEPESVMGASFQLSFAAVLSMIAFYEGKGRDAVRADRNWFMRGLLYVFGIGITTVLVSLATLPPVLHHFGRLQIFGVLANAIAIPLTTFVVMPAGMAAMVLMPIHWDGPFLKVANFGVDGTLWVAHKVATLPHAAIALPNLPTGWYIASFFGFLFLCLWHGRLRWLGIPIMVVAIGAGILFGERPIVMIDADGKSLGVAGGGQVAYFYKTPTEFIRDNWKSVWGGIEVNEGKIVKDPVWQSGDLSVSCDDWACRIVRAGGPGLSIISSATVLNEECNWAAMVVALDKAVGDARQAHCSARIIPFWDIRAGGGMALYNDGAWQARPFTPAGERRPWTLRYSHQ